MDHQNQPKDCHGSSDGNGDDSHAQNQAKHHDHESDNGGYQAAGQLQGPLDQLERNPERP